MMKACKVSQCCQCAYLWDSVHIMRQKNLQTTSICSNLESKAHKVIKLGPDNMYKILKVDRHSFNLSTWLPDI